MTERAHNRPMDRAWKRFVETGACDDPTIAAPVLRSWQRCADLNLDPYGPPRPALPTDARPPEVAALARSVMEDLFQFVASPGFAVLLADAQGIALHMAGDPGVLELVATARLGPGASWAEDHAGTNAIDLALREVLPVQTVGSEHYLADCHKLACTAAPFFDVAGQLLGVLAIVCAADAAHAHTLGMVSAAVQALHNQLRNEQLLSETNDHLSELNAVLETISEGLIFVSPQGTLRRINAHAAQMLKLNQRVAAGQQFDSLIKLPAALRHALTHHKELHEQEVLFDLAKGQTVAMCSLHPMRDSGQRYLGALVTLRPVQSVHRLVQQVVGAQAQFSFADVVGESEPMAVARHQARIAANSTATLLIYGEPGVGKHMLGQAIHNASSRVNGPFITLNCATVPRALLGAELFGIEGGEDGDRVRVGRPGKLELAHDGTIFLEDVSSLPLDIQTDLLRVIETHHTIRVEGRRVVPVNARIIVTSSMRLENLVSEGRFRAELAARLSVISLDLPPLRERGDDLLLLVGQMLPTLGEQLGKHVVLAPDALEALRLYNWPGNVRELEVTLERMLHMTEKNVLTLADLPPAIAQATHEVFTPLSESYNHAEREAILRAGRQAGGQIGLTANLLGISRATLWRKMRRLALTRDHLWP